MKVNTDDPFVTKEQILNITPGEKIKFFFYSFYTEESGHKNGQAFMVSYLTNGDFVKLDLHFDEDPPNILQDLEIMQITEIDDQENFRTMQALPKFNQYLSRLVDLTWKIYDLSKFVAGQPFRAIRKFKYLLPENPTPADIAANYVATTIRKGTDKENALTTQETLYVLRVKQESESNIQKWDFLAYTLDTEMIEDNDTDPKTLVGPLTLETLVYKYKIDYPSTLRPGEVPKKTTVYLDISQNVEITFAD